MWPWFTSLNNFKDYFKYFALVLVVVIDRVDIVFCGIINLKHICIST